jgi:phosphopantothenoylcysteine decarboxylase/phosphopantothenate--cysteine ligase
VELVRVRSAREMFEAMQAHARGADLVVMAAAVADYTPARPAEGKIEKSEGPLDLALVRTPDILAELGRQRAGAPTPVLVGFAAQSGDPVPRAREKLIRKHVDFIVANDISRSDAGFDSDTNAVTIVSADGDEVIPFGPKSSVAAAILDRAEARLILARPHS